MRPAAGKAWASLALYESTDLVKRLAKQRTGRQPSAAKAREIAAHFSQGREYFRSAAGASELVRPLILYYGAVALARGAVLLLNPKKSKVRGAHGLDASSWPDLVTRPGAVSELPVSVEEGGTFPELARTTGNSEWTKVYSHGMPGMADALAPGTPPATLEATMSLSLKEILGQIPDVSGLYERTFGEYSRRLRCEVEETNLPEPDASGRVFVRDVPPNQEVRRQANLRIFSMTPLGLPDHDWVESAIGANPRRLVHLATRDFMYSARDPVLRGAKGHEFLLLYDAGSQIAPRLEMPVTALPNGEEYLKLPAEGGVVLSTLLALHLAAYAAGMLVRYHPGYWAMLTGRTKGDAIGPILSATVSAIEERYPALILEAIAG